MSAITEEMVEAGVDEIRKAKHTCFDRWTDQDAIRAVLEASVSARIAALEAENERLRKALEACPLPSVMGNSATHYAKFYDWFNAHVVPALEAKP